MSKFSKKLKAIALDKHVEIPGNLGHIMDGKVRVFDTPHDLARLYKISIDFHAQITVPTSPSEKGDEVKDMMVRQTKTMMVDAVFGEFREDIHLLRQQLYQREYENAASTLSRLERNMFEVS